MKSNNIDILVTFDANYIAPFQTMLNSLIMNNPKENFHVWLIHNGLQSEQLQKIGDYCSSLGVNFTPIEVDEALFQNAPVTKQYPKEMYYRLLASCILPETIDKILYIDPDTLIINSVRPLWDIDMGDAVFAAASHSWGPELVNDINRIRLNTEHKYYNTGVILIDLVRARSIVNPDDIFSYVTEHSIELLLPDQDVFNALYSEYIFPIDDRIWNYDARYYSAYLLASDGQCNIDWIINNTAILHFCGKNKPWAKNRQIALVLYISTINIWPKKLLYKERSSILIRGH